MERKFKSFKKEFPPVKLYLDDLREIVNVLDEKNGIINIETDDYIFSSIDELKELSTDLIRNLDISCNNPYLMLSFRPFGASLYISEDNLENRGITSRIIDVILRCKRKLYTKIFKITNQIITSLIVAIPFVYYLKTNNFFATVTIGILSFISILLIAVLASLIIMKTHTIIFLKNKKDNISFYIRNKDKIILAILSAALGAVFTMLIQAFSQPFLGNK